MNQRKKIKIKLVFLFNPDIYVLLKKCFGSRWLKFYLFCFCEDVPAK